MKNLLLLLLFSILLFTCKKKDDEPETQPVAAATTGGTTTGGSTTGNGFVTSSVNILFTVSENTITMFPDKYSGVSGRAYFSATPQQYENQSTGLKMGKVFLNETMLPYTEDYKYYSFGSETPLTSATWSVEGANGFTSFSATSPVQTPSSSNLDIIPDNISIAAGVTLDINNVANMTNGMVIISGMQSSSMPAYKFLNTGNNQVRFNAAQLAPLGTGTMVVSIIVQNISETVIQGKSVRFTAEKQCSKYVTITN